MAEFTLKIDGMHCGSCVRRVSQALAATPGVVVNEVTVGSAKLSSPEQSRPSMPLLPLSPRRATPRIWNHNAVNPATERFGPSRFFAGLLLIGFWLRRIEPWLRTRQNRSRSPFWA